MKEVPKPLPSDRLEDCVQKWYANFVQKMKQDLLFEVILGANFMDIKELMSLGSASFAAMIKDKTVAEIRNMFGVTAEFTAEEEERIKAEHAWLLES